MIKSIWIDNFKSLVDFKLDLAKFSCLVGLNGSGKSTVLQAMDFLSRQMSGELDQWLKERQWNIKDINSKFSPKSNIDFVVEVEDKTFGVITWSGSFNREELRCTRERIMARGRVYLRVNDGIYSIRRGKENSVRVKARYIDGNRRRRIRSARILPSAERSLISFNYEGSIVSQLREIQLNDIVIALRNSIAEIKSLDLLSPGNLRANTKTSEIIYHRGKMGLGGQRFSGFLHEYGEDRKEILKRKLSKVYPELEKIETKSLKSGIKQLAIHERFNGKSLETTARHVNDGLLRLMAIFSQMDTGAEFLLFDEIENGINPELIAFVLDSLVNSNHQILVTSHSPMILNFLEDDVAKEGVIYLYKNKEGITKAIKLFDIPSLGKKLEFMGPGEAYIDTDLTKLYREVYDMEKSRS